MAAITEPLRVQEDNDLDEDIWNSDKFGAALKQCVKVLEERVEIDEKIDRLIAENKRLKKKISLYEKFTEQYYYMRTEILNFWDDKPENPNNTFGEEWGKYIIYDHCERDIYDWRNDAEERQFNPIISGKEYAQESFEEIITEEELDTLC